MTERRKARRYDLLLSVTVSSDGGKHAVQKGMTRDVSTRGVYVVLDHTVKKESFELTMMLRPPAGAYVRTVAKAVRTEEWTTKGRRVVGIGAAIQRYEIVRTDKQMPFNPAAEFLNS